MSANDAGQKLMESAGTWDSSQGAFISSRHQRMAEVLRDYNPNFSVAWVPPKDRDAALRFPFAIIDSTPGRRPYIMRYLTDEQISDPASVLAWVFEGDLSKHRPVDVLQRIELREAAQKLLDMRAEEERLAEQRDQLRFIAETPLHKFKIGSKSYSDYGG